MKPWYKSNTIRLAIIAFVVAILPVIAAFIRVVSPTTAMIVDAAVLMVVSILNIALRFLTDVPIETPTRLAESNLISERLRDINQYVPR
jgi:hypothetical protein